MRTRSNLFWLSVPLNFFGVCIPTLLTAQDTTPPVFLGITLQQDTVQNGDTLIMLLHAYDELSGIDMIQIGITDPQGGLSHSLYPHDDWFSGSDLYELEMAIGQWTLSGTYTITSVVITDLAQNLYMSGPGEFGSFHVASNSIDTIPPIAGPIMIYPDTIYGGETVTATMHVTDDLSGFKFCNFTLKDPNDEIVEFYFANFVADDTTIWGENILDLIGLDTYALDLEIPANTITGLHYFTAVFFDHSGNSMESTSESFYVFGDITTGDQMIEHASSPTIFPNPTTGTIRMIMKEHTVGNVQIFTLEGKLELNQTVQNGAVIELQHLPSGVHMLFLQTKMGDHTYRVMKLEE